MFAFLGSLWGVLTSVAILFPGAAALLNLPLIADSPLKGVYAAIAPVFSALAVLCILLRGASKLNRWEAALRYAIVFGAGAFVLLTLFVSVKTTFLHDAQWSDTTWDPLVHHSRLKSVLRTEIISRDGSVCVRRTAEGCVVEQSERIDPWELVALLLFVLAFVFLSAAFSAAGIHFYLKQIYLKQTSIAAT